MASPRNMVIGSRGLVRSKGGLIVSRETADVQTAADRIQTRWVWDKWKLFKRLIRFVISENWDITLTCKTCKTVVALAETTTNNKTVRCDCTDRLFTEGV